MGPKSANNESTSSDSREINMERFAYDVFVSIFIRLGVRDFPPFDRKPNRYENSRILKYVSTEVLCYQFNYRDQFMEVFKIPNSRHPFNNIEEFANFVNDAIKESDTYATDYPPDMVFTIFAMHAELYLYFQSENKNVDFAELPRSWYNIYTKDISKFIKDDISEITKVFRSSRRVEWTEAIVCYFLSEYFMPYGAKEGCSKIFRLVDDKFPKVILRSGETINPQLIERIAKSVLFEEAEKKLPASEVKQIPPPESADQTASSSTLARRRKQSYLSYSQLKQKKKVSKSLLKQSAGAPERQKVAKNPPERSIEEEFNDLRLG
ncbi:hypothetical protein TNCV_3475601 [Trichonephila clavipes]|nr:hypothetical protein TNCV_3475601 [Trichonephila clavipes]